ncbi:hypothetical protein EIN_253640 [Entamoeba invadens IP1]|uniref:C2 domain-containing protein n=1 Tax=Entamoeba invadens IP1 TaxID=370355 RepID=A0A0A1UEU5_ENTIV|nr:hypothetical protein EIN_253640 [Entamoeba invadens IP1]ELP95090.1 hypothetical protein EIN_253640 [Entamoeba invadens IP1]|eukprot:XP_004261861.1 hypothetical protein EIN_253640 [Entamoeba invadens IP1]
MNVEIELIKYGFAGEETNGYVYMTVKKPTILNMGFVSLSQIDVLGYGNNSACTRSSSHTFSNTISNYPQKIQSQINMFPINISSVGKEFPPGKHRLDFSFYLPQNFPTSYVTQCQSLSYSLQAQMFTSDGKNFSSEEVEFPVLYNHALISSLPLTVSGIINNLFVTIHATQTTLSRGENAVVYLSVSNLSSDINRTLRILLISECNDGSDVTIETLNEVSFELTQSELVNQQVVFPIDQKTCPSTVTPTNSLRHYIVVKMDNLKFTEKNELLALPLSISADAQNVVVEENKGKSVEIKPTYTMFPNVDSVMVSPGIEHLKTTNNSDMFVDHMRRLVCDANGKAIDGIYPFYESTTLKPGCTFGILHNRDCVINHTTKEVMWFKDDLLPQALLQQCENAVVTIQVLEAEGLNVRSAKNVPKVYCCVTTTPWKKSKEVQGICPAFDDTMFFIDVGNNRKNVILYLYDNSSILGDDLLGFVNIDLTKMPFPCAIEGWFEFRNSPLGEETYTGRVKLRIAYDKVRHSAGDVYVHIPDVISCFTKPIYSNSTKMQKQVKNASALCSQAGATPYCSITSNGSVVNKFEQLYQSL